MTTSPISAILHNVCRLYMAMGCPSRGRYCLGIDACSMMKRGMRAPVAHHNRVLLGTSMPQHQLRPNLAICGTRTEVLDQRPSVSSRCTQVHAATRTLTPMRLPTPPAKSTRLTLPCSSDACTMTRQALANKLSIGNCQHVLCGIVGNLSEGDAYVSTGELKGAEHAVIYARLADAWQTCRCASTLLVGTHRDIRAPAFAAYSPRCCQAPTAHIQMHIGLQSYPSADDGRSLVDLRRSLASCKRQSTWQALFVDQRPHYKCSQGMPAAQALS